MTAEASGQPGTKAEEERCFSLGLGGTTGKHTVTQGAPSLAALTAGPRAEPGMGWERGLLSSPASGCPNCRVAFCHLNACRCNFCSNKTCLPLSEFLAILVSGEGGPRCPHFPDPDYSCRRAAPCSSSNSKVLSVPFLRTR